MHTIYFWPDLVQGFKEIARVLKPGGRLVIGLSAAEDLRREGWVERGFNVYLNDEIIAAARAQGIEVEQVESIERSPRGLSYVYCGVKS